MLYCLIHLKDSGKLSFNRFFLWYESCKFFFSLNDLDIKNFNLFVNADNPQRRQLIMTSLG